MTKEQYIKQLPKAELHLHIEGTLEPELMIALAERNSVDIPYQTIEQVKEAYNFSCLQDFLDIYYAGAKVLITEQDFYDLTYAYLLKAKQENIKHVEIFFDPQTHTERDISFSTVITGIHKALLQGQKELGISSYIIMCFLRHLSEEEAFATLNEAIPYKDIIIGVGLDSSENGNPPSKFQNVFKKAKQEGFLAVAHAGEEGPCQNIKESINLLHVDRIDHGNSIIHDKDVQALASQKQLALTMCPLSNLKLKVTDNLSSYPIRELMAANLTITINSDDPAYFGGYINNNYIAVDQSLNLSFDEIKTLAINSVNGSFLSPKDKSQTITEIENYHHNAINKVTNKQSNKPYTRPQ